MDIEAYLARVGYEGGLEPTLTTLTNLHRAHLFSIPYENLDIHLGRPLTLELPQIFDKLVTQRRGGWCFEMNGLFAWALRELGFQVTLLGAAVNRTQLDGAVRGHLALRVDLGQSYLCDVGFGDGLLAPVPLTVGRYQQGLDYELARSGATWYLRNQPYGAASGFCFDLTPYQLGDFAEVCHALQTSPESGFVRVTVCTRFNAEGYAALRGATLRTVTAAGAKERVLADAADFETVLNDLSGLEHPEAAALWPRIWQSHLAWAAASN